jgi:drug/metabolite transporter (DMT)-like permease
LSSFYWSLSEVEVQMKKRVPKARPIGARPNKINVFLKQAVNYFKILKTKPPSMAMPLMFVEYFFATLLSFTSLGELFAK